MVLFFFRFLVFSGNVFKISGSNILICGLTFVFFLVQFFSFVKTPLLNSKSGKVTKIVFNFSLRKWILFFFQISKRNKTLPIDPVFSNLIF